MRDILRNTLTGEDIIKYVILASQKELSRLSEAADALCHVQSHQWPFSHGRRYL